MPRVDVEGLYSLAKNGDWPSVLAAWRRDSHVAQECAHYSKPSSGWTFLHQAAYFGDEEACRELIRWGADVSARSRDAQNPSVVATEHGHDAVAELLGQAGDVGSLWAAPEDARLLPGSSRWGEAQQRQAEREMRVSYAGGVVVIPEGRTYFVDSFERTLIGWHGTYSPPCDMDGRPLTASYPAEG